MKAKVNLTIDAELTQQARALSLNLSSLAEQAIAEAVRAEQNRRWIEENKGALDAYAQEIETHGLALASRRLF